MWHKTDEQRSGPPNPEIPQPQPERSVRTVAGLTVEVVQPSGGVVTSQISIKGEIRGSEDLYIDGEVEGTIQLTSGRVTIGPRGKVSANVDAREIVVRGQVSGTLHGREHVELGPTANVRGDIATLRIAIEEGAEIHSKVEITRSAESQGRRNTEMSEADAARPIAAGTERQN